jgi:hypothetical protein
VVSKLSFLKADGTDDAQRSRRPPCQCSIRQERVEVTRTVPSTFAQVIGSVSRRQSAQRRRRWNFDDDVVSLSTRLRVGTRSPMRAPRPQTSSR